MAVQTQIQTRRGTAATWTSTNPTLAAGEIGFESDTNKFKIGTGSTAWTALAYAANTSPLTTKGDLYTYSTTNDRLAVGNNGESLVADSSTSTGLRYQANFAAGKNKIINGDFGVWQRGTSFSATNLYQYTADRWFVNSFGGTTGTVTRTTFTPGAAPVAGYEGSYYANWTVAGSPSTNSYFLTRLEDVRTFAGQTVTFSFWAKSTTSKTIGIYCDQDYGSGGSTATSTSFSGPGQTLTTSWTRYSFTATLGSISGKTIGTNSFIAPTISVTSAQGAFDISIWGFQLEAGSVATAFQTATGTIQGETSACQRYYQKFGADSVYNILGTGKASSADVLLAFVPFNTKMRVVPTSMDTGSMASYMWETGGSTGNTPTTVTLNGNSSTAMGQVNVGKVGAFTTAAFYIFFAQNSLSGYLGFSAEL